MSDNIDNYKAQWSNQQDKSDNLKILHVDKARTELLREYNEKQKLEREMAEKKRQETKAKYFNEMQQNLKDEMEKEGVKTREAVKATGVEVKEAVVDMGGKTQEVVKATGDDVKASVQDVGNKLSAQVANAAEGLADEVAEKVTQEIIKTIEKAQFSRSLLTESKGDIPTSISLDEKFASVASTAASTEATEEVDETKYSKFKSTIGRINTLIGGRKI